MLTYVDCGQQRRYTLKTASMFDIIFICSELRVLVVDLDSVIGVRYDGHFILPSIVHQLLIEANIRFSGGVRESFYFKAIQRF